MAEATRTSLRLAELEVWRRERLQELVHAFRTGVQQMDFALTDSTTPIQPIIAGSSETALDWSKQLEAQGILVAPIRPPTVPEGTARLRITFSASHGEHHLRRLLDALAGLRKG